MSWIETVTEALCKNTVIGSKHYAGISYVKPGPSSRGGTGVPCPPQTLVVPPATVYLNYYETRLCGRDVLVPI